MSLSSLARKLARLRESRRPSRVSELGASDRGHSAPIELQVLIHGLFQNALLVAVSAEALQDVLIVTHGADAVALNAARAQLRHVGRTGAHQGNCRNAVDRLEGGFERSKDV